MMSVQMVLLGNIRCDLPVQGLHEALWAWGLSLAKQGRRECLGDQHQLFELDAREADIRSEHVGKLKAKVHRQAIHDGGQE